MGTEDGPDVSTPGAALVSLPGSVVSTGTLDPGPLVSSPPWVVGGSAPVLVCVGAGPPVGPGSVLCSRAYASARRMLPDGRFSGT